VMEQAAAALELPDEDIKRSAAEWLAKQNLDPEYQDKVARSLEGLLTDSDPRMKQTAIRALDRWATKDNVKALVGLLDNNQLRPAVVAILGRLKDDQAIAPLALRLHLPPQDQIALVLVSYGSKAEKAVQVQLTNTEPVIRQLACRILAQIGTNESRTVLINSRTSIATERSWPRRGRRRR